jgi:hypothetical protein
MQTYDPNKSATEVRQANPRKGNLRVLVVGLIGIVVLFAIVYFIYTATQVNPT